VYELYLEQAAERDLKRLPTSGILLIDKPAGVTSFGVVRRARQALKVKKIGHLGTLDPFATGLLPLCLGEATKLVPFLLPEPKTYRAEVYLGVETTTQDLTGEVVARGAALPLPGEIYRVAAGFVGELAQIPPMYSALHYQGQRLYRLARQGQEIELPPRKVHVYHLVVDRIALPVVTLTVTCSQGTYIRALARDLGAALGCGAHLTGLRRLQVGSWGAAEALTLAALEDASPQEIGARIMPLAQCLPRMRQVQVGAAEAQHVRQGRPLTFAEADWVLGEQVRIATATELVAVARVQRLSPQTVLAPVRVFAGSGQ
jgi:tRNA pseudouridine55 synthase